MTVSGNPISPDNLPLPEDTAVSSGAAAPEAAPAAPIPSAAEASVAGYDLDAVTDLAGKIIAHYCVEERLGGGAMGSVYRAYDEKNGRMVALKVLLPGADSILRERFRREARTVSTLKHPHIVRTLQVGQTLSSGVIFIAMELVEGASLAELLEQHGRLTPRDACAILAPIAQALAYAHGQGVVHRDVKPSNILLRRVSAETPGAVALGVLSDPVVPLLSDFGIARAMDAPELTSAGRTIGTPAFMAPEQCAGSGEIDGRADIYSLGAVLYRCLIGRAPFSGSTTQILHAHVYDPVMIPEAAARTMPPAVLAILTRSMVKEPAQRYPEMALVAEELARSAALLPAAERTAPPPDDGDTTRTMAVLPTTSSLQAGAARILVPAAPVTPRSMGVVPLRPAPSATAVRPLPPPRVQPARRLPRSQVGALILGGALMLLLLVLAVTVFSRMLPSVFSSARPPRAAQATPTQVESMVTAAPAAGPPAPAQTPSQAQAQSGLAVLASPEPARGPTPTPTREPPPAVPLDSAWSDAQAFFAERDWRAALDWLIIVRRIDEEFEPGQVESMMVMAYVGLATDATVAGRLEEAVDFFDEALEVSPNSALVKQMHAATVALAEAGVGERIRARQSVQRSHADYAASLLADDPCAASEHLAAAIRVLSDPPLLERLAAYEQSCTEAQTADVLSQLGGRIIYSAQQDSIYRIFQMAVGQTEGESSSLLLVNNGTQPSLSPDGRVLAFFSTRPDAQGLYGFDLMAGLSVDDRSLRFSNAVEDARDAPARWSAQGDRLAFTSTRFGDNRYRVYVTYADSGDDLETLGYGKDPAWNPYQDLLVFNGSDEAGNSPGLWLMRADGSGRVRLTDNGNDQRPAWTPDGSAVVFMSNGRDGNWELYRVDVADLSITRLTDHPAQDGLPAISPDGQYVAFMSDRDGYWRIWFVPVEGGEAQPLGRISGELPKWLEHAIQWVK
ncbi:MAG: protein kinase [Caldilineaceae bacterium]|nr:protein kinase [Caldilineaceae bacterium]